MMFFNIKKKGPETGKKARKIGKDLDFASVEAYNLLRTNLSFSLPDKEGGKIIGITSPCPQEGKSTTSLNLSYSLAEAGHKVLLIDADLRRPSLAKAIDVPMVPGLSNLLVDEKSENAIHQGILHPNLSVLLSGNIPPNPSELVGSKKMKSLLDDFASHFDFVIVDLPPVNSVSDPLAASKHVDGMIVVVRHGHTRRKDIAEAIRQLEQVNAKIFGFVYNGIYKTKPGYVKSE
jgi:capsular exopolysaccharide synthesis family protein